jgi:hypothetical protein
MTEAQGLLAGLDEKTAERKAAKEGLNRELQELAVKLKREQKIAPIELTAASLGAQDGSFISPAFKDGKIYVMDLAGESLVEVNVLNKETKRYRLPDGTARVTSVATGASGLYLITDAKTMLSFDPKTGAYLATAWTTKASSTQGLVLYGRRFYVLDALANMIWRYAPVGGGVAQETAYLKQNSSSLADTAGMAIDANVYVAWQNGVIRRFRALPGFGLRLIRTASLSPTRQTSVCSCIARMVDWSRSSSRIAGQPLPPYRVTKSARSSTWSMETSSGKSICRRQSVSCKL